MSTEVEKFFEDAPTLQTIILMRIYDVLMADFTAREPGAAGALRAFHEDGGVMMPPITFDPSKAGYGND